MKTIAILISLFLSSLAFSQDQTGTITVSVTNLSSEEGNVYFGLYTEADFLKKAPLKGEVTTIKNGVAEVSFTEVQPGTYAISAYHDKNGNERMDFDTNGAPQENYGISNNQINLYGPPLWEDAKFQFDGSQKDINLTF
ncbi:DUF2141 domain-containing protein [Salegentibacter maritimus]|uniref:DUF2141 domain-containing protein n=1 Tax=Salegentibacter maritimus TaxID=2794347 RepID=A0ABS0THH7_9FLAO|nr:DUF2141 domain-containing protein [Salegentibacter maritimus]MBI6120481.1 DUF2141 domain-containing protein [Salegentibacter maritimus]